MYYYYYYEQACEIPDIREAFERICLHKMLYDGYCDMSQYITNNMTKGSVYGLLTQINSPYAPLYHDKNAFPKANNIVEQWHTVMQDDTLECDNLARKKMSEIEAESIVRWVYAAFKTKNQKQKFTEDVFSQIKELASIHHSIRFKKGILYNFQKVEIHIFDSLPKIIEFVTSITIPGKIIFYRGHSAANYRLVPSIMRTSQLEKSEDRLYQEIQVRCPEEFTTCHSHLEKLVKMQHYGLPTRLLDITRNLLVAIYFACENHFDAYGEVILLTTTHELVKYPTSDAVTILASLAALRYDVKEQLNQWANDSQMTVKQFNEKSIRFIQEIRLEKPAFTPQIQKEDIQKNLIVHATKDNKRIVEQNGAFIICGIQQEKEGLEAFKVRKGNKKTLIFVENKAKILKELEACSISKATLFPEIECVSEYLKAAYTQY